MADRYGDRSRLTEIEITSLGHKGDGVALVDGEVAYAPYTAPGDKIVAERQRTNPRLRVRQIVQPSEYRVSPACEHFGVCGGCQLQHLDQPFYRAWKRDQVVASLSQRGIHDAHVGELTPGAPGSRRRATLHARKSHGRAELGFLKSRTTQITDLAACPILTSKLEKLISPLRDGLSEILQDRERCKIDVLETREGVSIGFKFSANRELDLDVSQTLSQLAERLDLACVVWDSEPAVVRRNPQLSIGKHQIPILPGRFIQASEAAEERLSRVTVEALNRAGHVADLFCGLGAFALRIAPAARVHAVDFDAQAINDLGAAVKRLDLEGRVVAERRDLFRRPLAQKELEQYDGVIFDPPRAGAAVQAEEIAKSDIATAVGVSCNPATFARDARILIDGGYSLEQVTPVDQFFWTPHIELVGVFRRRS
jgi:23S rRNA (uracil1939-C5)-methyltransferase